MCFCKNSKPKLRFLAIIGKGVFLSHTTQLKQPKQHHTYNQVRWWRHKVVGLIFIDFLHSRNLGPLARYKKLRAAQNINQFEHQIFSFYSREKICQEKYINPFRDSGSNSGHLTMLSGYTGH